MVAVLAAENCLRLYYTSNRTVIIKDEQQIRDWGREVFHSAEIPNEGYGSVIGVTQVDQTKDKIERFFVVMILGDSDHRFVFDYGDSFLACKLYHETIRPHTGDGHTPLDHIFIELHRLHRLIITYDESGLPPLDGTFPEQ